MDYRINNEALAACVITLVVNHNCSSLPIAVGVTNLLLQDRQRKKALRSDIPDELIAVFGQLDGGLLTVIINSLVMLMQGKCMAFHDGMLELTDRGIALCASMNEEKSCLLSRIVKDIPSVLKKIEPITSDNVFNRFYIAL